MLICFLVGGSGLRLWPLSRENKPKQFLSLANQNHSSLQESYLRFASLVPKEKMFFVGMPNTTVIEAQLEQIQVSLPKENFIAEPMPRNTAAAILLFLRSLPAKFHEETILFVPSDHYVKEQENLLTTIQQAQNIAIQNKFVIFGITPTYAETGYGYIEVAQDVTNANQMNVVSFHEKPNKQTAETYLKQDAFYWNSGMFLAQYTTFLQAFQTHAPELFATLPSDCSSIKKEELYNIYHRLPSISFDYAVMEKQQNLVACKLDLTWSDLGSWESVHQIAQKDENQNVTFGNVVVENTKNSLLLAQDKLVVAIGMENCIVIDTKDALLLCDITKTQQVKDVVTKLKETQKASYFISPEEKRPWGSFEELFQRGNVKIKELVVLPQKRLSLQKHQHREEHWVVSQGTALITNGETTETYTEGSHIFIPKTQIHRIENQSDIVLKIIEIQKGDYLGEDDIERIEDDFSRA